MIHSFNIFGEQTTPKKLESRFIFEQNKTNKLNCFKNQRNNSKQYHKNLIILWTKSNINTQNENHINPKVKIDLQYQTQECI